MRNPFTPYLADLKRRLVTAKGRISEVSGKRAEGAMKRRIFNDGQDVNGEHIGTYSTEYARKRRAKGRQAEYVDLQFTGDLFRSIELGLSKERATLGFSNAAKQRIAAKLETQFKKSIFALTIAEAQAATEAAQLELNAIIEEWAAQTPDTETAEV